ncbi:MAG: hypothetical protein ACRDRV_05770 [Pseudonocardiaceae bacterium]
MKSRVHAVAGFVGLTLIVLFFTSSVVVELIGDEHAVTRVKTLILFGVLVLVPSMMVVGATGRILAGRRDSPLIRAKKKRMIGVAAIGLTVLVPCAVVLQRLAVAGDFDTAFYAIQTVELIGGAVNIVLLGLNVRAGRLLAGRSPVRAAARSR